MVGGCTGKVTHHGIDTWWGVGGKGKVTHQTGVGVPTSSGETFPSTPEIISDISCSLLAFDLPHTVKDRPAIHCLSSRLITYATHRKGPRVKVKSS